MMTRRTAPLVLAVLLAATLPAPAQEKYDIKLRKLAQGETDMVYKTEVETNTSYSTDGAGKKVQEQETLKKETRMVYRETILEKAADHSVQRVRLRRL